MQPYFLPYIGSFQLIHSVDKYVFMGYLSFRKEAWHHKNRMIIRNQGPSFFCLKLISKSSYKSFNDIQVDPSMYWREKLVKTIQHNYCKAPFFEECFDLFRSVINCNSLHLDDYNANSMLTICQFLDVNTIIENYSSEYLVIEDKLRNELDFNNTDTDLSHKIDVKTQRVIDICRHENAEVFINAIGGQELYSKELFAAHNIGLFFIKSREIRYKQAWSGFAPDLSILDVLMNCGKLQTKQYLTEYNLV